MRSAHDETVLGLIRKDAPNPEFDFTARVSFDEAAYSGGFEVIEALRNFAVVARAAILLFK